MTGNEHVYDCLSINFIVIIFLQTFLHFFTLLMRLQYSKICGTHLAGYCRWLQVCLPSRRHRALTGVLSDTAMSSGLAFVVTRLVEFSETGSRVAMNREP